MFSLFAYGESEDKFDEIVSQLQGMKAVLENMKQDYETRLKEMQEKIAVLEKERAQTTEKVSQPTSTAEAPIAGAEEIRMKKRNMMRLLENFRKWNPVLKIWKPTMIPV